MTTFSVIDYLTTTPNHRIQIFIEPYGCADCPFATPKLDYDGRPDYNRADPDEGHYNCSLLGRNEIWGENPQCTTADWLERVKQEINALRSSPP